MKKLVYPLLMALLSLTACNSDPSKAENSTTESTEESAPEVSEKATEKSSEPTEEATSDINSEPVPSSAPKIGADPGPDKLSNEAVIELVRSNYPNLALVDGEQRFCEDNLYYKMEVATVYYYQVGEEIRALGILGNTLLNEEGCEEKAEFVSHVAAGRCDGVLMKLGADGWEVMHLAKEVTTGGGNGEWGAIGEPFQFGLKYVGIPILTGWMGMGETFESAKLVGVVDDKVEPIIKIDTHWDNAGSAMSDEDYKCSCVSYAFLQGYDGYHELLLQKRDCSGEKGYNCEGPIVVFHQQAAVNGKYRMPEGFALD